MAGWRQSGIMAGALALLVAGVPGVALAGTPATFSLVSPEEAGADAQAQASGTGAPLATKAFDPMGPAIVVIAPRIDGPTRPPLDVRVEARPRNGLAIDRGSLKVRYGFLRLDVTSRLLPYGQWQGNAFVVTGAQVPAGNHTFYVAIADSAGHVGEAVMKVVVLGH